MAAYVLGHITVKDPERWLQEDTKHDASHDADHDASHLD